MRKEDGEERHTPGGYQKAREEVFFCVEKIYLQACSFSLFYLFQRRKREGREGKMEGREEGTGGCYKGRGQSERKREMKIPDGEIVEEGRKEGKGRQGKGKDRCTRMGNEGREDIA